MEISLVLVPTTYKRNNCDMNRRIIPTGLKNKKKVKLSRYPSHSELVDQ